MERYGTSTDGMSEPRDESHPESIPAGDRRDEPQPAIGRHSDRHDRDGDDQSGVEPVGAAGTSQADIAGRHPDLRSERPAQSPGSLGDGQQYSSLLSDREAGAFLDRWREVQARFVDDPQNAVKDGDALVVELVRSLADRFTEQKAALEEQWNSGGEPETEQLRLALQEYRSFFNRLLST